MNGSRRSTTFARLASLATVACAAACGDGAKSPADGGAPAGPPPRREFVEIGEAAGVTTIVRSGNPEQKFIPEVKALGVAMFDYDGDDRPDLLFTAGSTLERFAHGEPGFGCTLYRNLTEPGGPIRFVDATAAAKIPATAWAGGPCVGDYDGDGFLDVLVSGFGGARLWRNRGDGTFTDATDAARVKIDGWSTGAAWGDLDGDGDLDLYVARYLAFDVADPPRHGPRYTCLWKNRVVLCGPRGLPALPDVALRNEGDGTFTDATKAWGFDAAPPQYGLGVVIEDVDDDGRNDVFVANDSGPSFLWRNKGGRFVEDGFASGVAFAEDGGETAGMGVDAADLNGDGVPDFVVTNFEGQSDSIFLSRKDGGWLESSRTMGVALASLPDLSFGCGLEDFDLDGDLDLFVANGHVYPEAAEPGLSEAGYRQACRLFLREGARFRDGTADFGPALAATKRVGRGAAFGDLDGDGDVDVVVVNLNERPSVFENRGGAPRAGVALRLRGVAPNAEAIGARVRVESDGRVVDRTVRRNRSFQASGEARLVFGLGGAARTGRVVVRWPDGSRETFGPYDAGSNVDLVRGKGSR